MGGATPAPPPIFLYTKGTKGSLVEGTKAILFEGTKGILVEGTKGILVESTKNSRLALDATFASIALATDRLIPCAPCIAESRA